MQLSDRPCIDGHGAYRYVFRIVAHKRQIRVGTGGERRHRVNVAPAAELPHRT
ncbi:hypothetical protein [Vibrio nigripulchritudo]|uniref:hypothetical protein n=1 Tax=Vibrio nigripulchritudo TaxID=28173 RepID=UPI00137938C3|nr:hypothetical protein [Vibrio nigripulchritudo]